MIAMRPYIKNIVNEVKFTYVAEEYKLNEFSKLNKTTAKKDKKKGAIKELDLENNFVSKSDNTVSLNAETAFNLFEDLGYDLKAVRAGQNDLFNKITKRP